MAAREGGRRSHAPRPQSRRWRGRVVTDRRKNNKIRFARGLNPEVSRSPPDSASVGVIFTEFGRDLGVGMPRGAAQGDLNRM